MLIDVTPGTYDLAERSGGVERVQLLGAFCEVLPWTRSVVCSVLYLAPSLDGRLTWRMGLDAWVSRRPRRVQGVAEPDGCGWCCSRGHRTEACADRRARAR